MARISKVQELEQEAEQAALAFFERMLSGVTDPRRAQGQRYPLRSVVVVTLMAAVCGADDADAAAAWGEANEAWLAGFLDLPHGTPTQDVILAVLAGLDPKEFGAVLRSWAALLAARIPSSGAHIAVDGKTSRRSHDTAHGTPAIHTVSAFLTGRGLVLGATKTDQKSNEINAMPDLLRLLDLRGATVTIDAMGCQTEIAETITDKEGAYLLAVKDNQPTLRRDIEATFAEAADDRRRAVDEPPRLETETHVETEKDHGRLETRTVTVCRDLSWLTTAERWPRLAYVVQVTRERTIVSTGKRSEETAYYIGSDPTATIAAIGTAIRRHWAIENELHWILDMAFREDDARHRARNTAQNMTILRHFALNIIKLDTTRKLGVANARKRAGWDRTYLLQLLNGAAV
jgi:predicted transposase YbfD/YdcC